MTVEVRSYNHDDWTGLVDLITEYWAEDHPITNRELFDWQYRGFGHSSNFELFKVLVVNGQLLGFRGVIPGLYHLPNSADIVPGGTFAMWLVAPELRGTGMGYKLMEAIEAECSVLMSVGSTLSTSGRIYAANNFTYLDKFHRWVIGFDTRYLDLLREKVEDVKFSPSVNTLQCEIEPDPAALSKIWAKFIEKKRYFSLARNEAFWRWRYIDSPGFSYNFFGNNQGDIVVARIEKDIKTSDGKCEGLNVLRVIEIINSGDKESIRHLLASVLNWAMARDCCGADFQASNQNFHDVLSSVGFRKQEGDFGSGVTSLAGLFRPFKYAPDPINAFWRVRRSGREDVFNGDQTYIMKSDNDMDRPNYWPV